MTRISPLFGSVDQSPHKRLRHGQALVRRVLLAPTLTTTGQREFDVAMLLLALNRIRCAKFAPPTMLLNGLLYAWPRTMKSLRQQHFQAGQAGLLAFQALLCCRNPRGVAASLLGCAVAHQLTPWLPETLHNTARTVGFVSGLVWTTPSLLSGARSG